MEKSNAIGYNDAHRATPISSTKKEYVKVHMNTSKGKGNAGLYDLLKVIYQLFNLQNRTFSSRK